MVVKSAQSASLGFERWFPTPQVLVPHSVGFDISDGSIKWLGLTPTNQTYYKVATSGIKLLSPGIVTGGVVRDTFALGAALAEVRKELGGVVYAHAALPEEVAYVFSMNVPSKTSREQIQKLIEFEFEGRVPIPPNAAIYDFDVIQDDSTKGMEIGIAAFPKEVAEAYAAAFETANIGLLSLELEARSIARAVSDNSAQEPITLLVDFGVTRTGFALLKQSVPIFTSTVEVGGQTITRAAIEKLSLSEEEAEKFKNEEGLISKRREAAPAIETMTKAVTVLSEEIMRHFHYWDTRRDEHGNRVTPVQRVILVGGSANLAGLAEFIARKVQVPVERGDIWHNICSFDDYVPPIDNRTSLQYATAAGLALRGV